MATVCENYFSSVFESGNTQGAEMSGEIAQVQDIHPDCQVRILDGFQTHDIKDTDSIYCGVGELRRAFEVHYARPEFHGVYYMVSGRALFSSGDEEHRLSAGSMLVSPAYQEHHFRLVGKSAKVLFFYLNDGLLWKPVMEQGLRVSRARCIEELEHAMEGFCQEMSRDEHDSARVRRLFAELVEIRLRRDLEMNEDPTSRRLRQELYQLWEKVNADVGRDWCVTDLANELHMSTACFYRACAKYAGVKPMAMVTNLRMRKGEQLLRVTDHPLKIIAEEVGYSSAFSFSEAFRRYSGMSPKMFRKNNRGEGWHVSPQG